MAKENSTDSVRDFQARVNQIVADSTIKQLSVRLAAAEKAKLAELSNQAKIAANGQMLNAETEAAMEETLKGLENKIAKIGGQISNLFFGLKKQASEIATEMHLDFGKFGIKEIFEDSAKKEGIPEILASGKWKKNSAEQRRLNELLNNKIKPYENANPNYENLTDEIINDIAEMKHLYGLKFTGNNKREYKTQTVAFIAALNRLKTTQEAIHNGLLNGMDPEAIKEIEEAQKAAAVAMAKMKKAHDEQTAVKIAYQNDPRGEDAKKADKKYDFTTTTTAWNDSQIEYVEAISKVEAVIKRMPIVQQETENKIVEIKKESAEKQAQIVDLHQKDTYSEQVKVAEQVASFEVNKAGETAQAVSKIKKNELKELSDAQLEELIKSNSSDIQAARDERTARQSAQRKAEQATKEEQRELKQQQRKAESDKQFDVRQDRLKAERKAEQLARDEKMENLSRERREQMEKQHQEKLDAIEKAGKSGRMANTIKGAAVAGAGMLGVYGVADSIQRGVGMGVDFGASMNLVQAIGGFSDKDKSDLEANALAIGSATSATASEVAMLQVELVKLGKSKEEIIGSTQSLIEFSRTFQTDLAETASVGAKTAQVFGVDVPRMMDIMGATFRNTAVKDLSQFEEAIASGSAMAKALNFTAEQTMAFLGTAINNGQKADEASRGLQKLLQSARNTDSEFAKYFGGTAKDFDEVISRINGMSEAEKEVALTKMKSSNLTEENAKNLLIILMNSGDKIQELNDKLVNSAGLTAEAYAKSMDSMKNQWELVTSEIETKALDIYKDLEPQLMAVTKALQSFFDTAADPDSSTTKLIELVEALTVAVAALGAVSGAMAGIPMLITKIITSLKALKLAMISNPVTAVIAGVTALTAAIYTYIDSAEEELEKNSQRLELQRQNNQEATEAAEKNKAMTEEYEKLAGKENKSNSEKERMSAILGDLKKIYPDIITETTSHAQALDQVKLAAEKANKELESLAGVEKIRKRAELENTIASQNLKVDEALDNVKDRDPDDSQDSGYITYRQVDLIGLRANPSESSVAKAEQIIEELEAKRLELQSKGNDTEELKELIANAITYRDELKKLVDTKKELAILSNTTAPAGDKDKPTGTGSGGDDEAVSLDAKQQLELKLMRLKNIADIAKFESDQDSINYEKKTAYAKANYDYQAALATQARVNFAENNPEKLQQLKNAEKIKLQQLEETLKDEIAQIAMSIDLTPIATKKLQAQLGELGDKDNSFKYKVMLEEAVYAEKVKQYKLQLDSGKMSQTDYDLNVRIAELMKLQNIEIARRMDITKEITIEGMKLETEKLKSDSADFGLDADMATNRAAKALSELDTNSKSYELERDKIFVMLDNDLKEIDKKSEQAVSNALLTKLKYRQQESGRDYGIDKEILDKEYWQKRKNIDDNTSLTPEQWAAETLKAESDWKIAQEKLLKDHMNYYIEMSQAIFSTIAKVADYYNKKEMDAAKRKYDYETKLADKSYNDKVKANQGANRTLAKLAEQEEKDKEAREKAWEKRQEAINAKKKKWAIAETILNMTVAIARAFALEGPFGWGEAIALGAQLTSMTVTLAAQQFAKGKVLINNPDDPSDRVLAWFNPGESVINEKSSQANAALLHAINNANGPYIPDTPDIRTLIVQNPATDNGQLLAEIRQLRADYNALMEINTNAIESKSWDVKVSNESKGYDPRQVSTIVREGNNKNAKLTVWGGD